MSEVPVVHALQRPPAKGGAKPRIEEFAMLEVGWRPLSRDGIAMCQTRGFEAQAVGVGIHGRSYNHRRVSGKERIPVV